MEPDRDTLNAFVDGELPPKEMERIAALLETRPDLERYVRGQERLRAALKDAFTPATPVPERLAAVVRTAPVSWRWRLRGQRLFIWSGLGAAAALAAGLVIGMAIRPVAGITTDASGRLVARGDLGAALSTRLAAAGYPGSGPRLGISYRDKSGHDCRTFTYGGDSGLACRRDGDWVIGLVVHQPQEEPHAAYRMAGSEMPDAVRRAVEDSIDGAPFDAAAEEAARARGWSGR